MQVMSNGVTIYCTDMIGTHKILSSDFDESIDEITVYSETRNTELQRGWIGDLEYVTIGTENVEGERVKAVRDSWKDVLLTRVRLSVNVGEPNMWEYRFLKK